jgi:hypothetical protein
MEKLRRTRKQWMPEINTLERRELPAITALHVTAAPMILTPPQGQYVKVLVKGELFNNSKNSLPQLRYQVTDEYRQIQPAGPVVLTPLGGGRFSFQFRVALQARVASADTQGRLYFMAVIGEDANGSLGRTLHFLVPNGPVPKSANAAARRA